LGADHPFFTLIHVHADTLHVAIALKTVTVVGAICVDTLAMGAEACCLSTFIMVSTGSVYKTEPWITVA